MASPTVMVLETQLDDLNPQAIGYLFDRLFELGALDVFTQAIGMKKSRPGVLLTVICPVPQTESCERAIFTETTTLGIRRRLQERTVLDRRFDAVTTPYGSVQVKVAKLAGELINVQPEYEDCAQLAQQHQIPWREIHRLALNAWYAQNP
jgi:pyridinium-3,5-bisthiocarboxylic acid mononucleotide nickel chelatase